MDIPPIPDPDAQCTTNSDTLPVPPELKSLSDRYWASHKSEGYRCIRTKQEKDVMALPWGPRIDVLFDPKRAPLMVAGKVRILARTSGSEVPIASATITNVNEPIALSASAGCCDAYVVRASAGDDATANSPKVESYFFARVYDSTTCPNGGTGGSSGGPIIVH